MHSITIPAVVDRELAYFFGVLAGDGHVGIREKKHEYSVECAGNPRDEKDFYECVISPLIKNKFGLSAKMKLHDSGATFGFRIFSKNLVQYLTEDIGIPFGKKDNLSIPPKIKNNRELTLSYIRGVFDTDGCVSFKRSGKYPVITITSKYSSFIREISDVLKSEGFKVSTMLDYEVKDIRFKSGFFKISRLQISGWSQLEKWLTVIGTLHPRNLEKLKKYRG